jgi:hypothetical protein
MPGPILSPRRRAVAILALSGLSNHELGITPDTVPQTLRFVYDSLGIQPGAGRRDLGLRRGLGLRRDLGRALVAHGIISVLDLPARRPSRSNGRYSGL